MTAMKGNFPFAVLHEQRTNGTPKAIALAISLSKQKMTKKDGIEYVRACVVTSGHPHLLDLYEEEKVEPVSMSMFVSKTDMKQAQQFQNVEFPS
jgi:hypothetical protein